jgi:1-aminocyclopropane-1-carboxylate deaminase/D-cysteine desulfhydrase-like pyridoxal-dependent ACC family enzyme
MNRDELVAILSRVPRTRLAHVPTPLERCDRLADTIGATNVFVKRDDCMGDSFGGNKVRHMEFRLADASLKGCDAFIFADKSNAARATAAACAKIGMRCILLIPGHHNGFQGNLLLSHLLGAELIFLDTTDYEESLLELEMLKNRLESAGARPYAVQLLEWDHISAVLSYLDVALELMKQFDEVGVDKAQLFLVTGHSHVGLQLAVKLLDLPWHVTGVAVGQFFENDLPHAEWAKMTTEYLGISQGLSSTDINVTFSYVGSGLGTITSQCREAILTAGSKQGIILDPSYTGKAMAALIDHARRGNYGPDEALVFVHTGGTPIVFESAQELSSGLF